MLNPPSAPRSPAVRSPAVRALRLVWSALWRAQLSHLLVVALLPASAALLHVALGIVLLPFVLLGAGDRHLTFGSQVAHLNQPSCWIALAPCPIADCEIVALGSREPAHAGPEAGSGTTPPPMEPFLPMPSGVTVRHVWFVLWLAWFLWHVVRRERQ